MLTMEILRKLPAHSIFAAGVFRDVADGVSITGVETLLLKWIAVRGEVADWAVYVGSIELPLDDIRSYGDKISVRSAVILVECNTEAESAYRP